MSKTFLFQAIQFCQTIQISISIPLVLSGAATPGQSGPGSNSNEGVHRIPQSSSITGDSPSDYLVSYPGHSLGGGSAVVVFYSPSRLGNKDDDEASLVEPLEKSQLTIVFDSNTRYQTTMCKKEISHEIIA